MAAMKPVYIHTVNNKKANKSNFICNADPALCDGSQASVPCPFGKSGMNT
jgi:hypothetical protein